MTEKEVKQESVPHKPEEKAKPKAEKKPKPEKKQKEEVKKAPEEKKPAPSQRKHQIASTHTKAKNLVVDCTLPVKDKVFQAKELVEYFQNKIKVDGKTKNFGKNLSVGCEDGKKIKVNAEIPLAKRYLKYLAKKFLKKQEVRDYLRLVAPNKGTYEFKYFKMESGE